jgi:hypothetical protein
MAKFAVARLRAHAPRWIALLRRRDPISDGRPRAHLLKDSKLLPHGEAVELQYGSDAFGFELWAPFQDRHAQARVSANRCDCQPGKPGTDDGHVNLP